MQSEEMTLFRDMARRAFEAEISPHYEQWEEEHMVPRELWRTLGAAGLLCADVDEAYGGAGTSPQVTLMLIEELSRMGFGGFASGRPLPGASWHRGAEAAVAAEDGQR